MRIKSLLFACRVLTILVAIVVLRIGLSLFYALAVLLLLVLGPLFFLIAVISPSPHTWSIRLLRGYRDAVVGRIDAAEADDALLCNALSDMAP